jgi:hypothetical protein
MSSLNTKLVSARVPLAVHKELLRLAGKEPLGTYLRDVLTKHTQPPSRALIHELSKLADRQARKGR